MTLSLGDDGTATLTQSPDAVNEITSFGRWIRQGDIIRLNFESVGKQPAPAPHVLPPGAQNPHPHHVESQSLAHRPAPGHETYEGFQA